MIMNFERRFARLGFAFNHVDDIVNSRAEALTDFQAVPGSVGAGVLEQNSFIHANFFRSNWVFSRCEHLPVG